MDTKILDQQQEINSAQNLTKASEDSNKRMNLSTEKPFEWLNDCLLYTSPSPRDATLSRMPSSA